MSSLGFKAFVFICEIVDTTEVLETTEFNEVEMKELGERYKMDLEMLQNSGLGKW